MGFPEILRKNEFQMQTVMVEYRELYEINLLNR